MYHYVPKHLKKTKNTHLFPLENSWSSCFLPTSQRLQETPLHPHRQREQHQRCHQQRQRQVRGPGAFGLQGQAPEQPNTKKPHPGRCLWSQITVRFINSMSCCEEKQVFPKKMLQETAKPPWPLQMWCSFTFFKWFCEFTPCARKSDRCWHNKVYNIPGSTAGCWGVLSPESQEQAFKISSNTTHCMLPDDFWSACFGTQNQSGARKDSPTCYHGSFAAGGTERGAKKPPNAGPRPSSASDKEGVKKISWALKNQQVGRFRRLRLALDIQNSSSNLCIHPRMQKWMHFFNSSVGYPNRNLLWTLLFNEELYEHDRC